MDHRVNPENESKSTPVTRSVLTNDIMFVDEHGNYGLIKAGILPDTRLQIKDQNGNVIWEESLWK